MKSNNKQAKSKKKDSKIFDKRYYAWFSLILILSTVSYEEAMNVYGDTRFLLYTIGLSVYALFFYFFKNKDTIVKSKTIRLFYSIGLLFIIWNIISAFGSISYYESLIPIANISIFGLSTFFIMESMSKKNAMKDSFRFFTLFTFFHAVVAILQIGDVAFTELMHGSSAPYGFTGNRNYIGGLLAACICFPTYLAIKSDGKWKWFSLLTIIITFIAIVFSETRTAYIALIGLLFLGIIGWVLANGLKNIKSLVRSLSIGLLVFILSIFSIYFFKPDTIKSVKDRIAVVTGFSTGMNGGKLSIRHRLKVWEGSINIFKDNPILGVGPGNWRLVIPIYGKGASPRVNKNKSVMAHPHNVYLHILSEIGLIGLLLYLSIIVIVLIAAYKLIKNKNKDNIAILFLCLGIIAYLIDSLASLSVVKTEQSFLFAFFFGALLSFFELNSKEEKNIPIHKNIILIVSAIILSYSFIIAKANFNFSKASKIVQSQSEQLGSQRVIQIVNENKSNLIKLSPLSYPLELFSMRAYRDSKMYDKAYEEFNSAIKYHPNNSTILESGATIYMSEGKFKEAIPWLEKGIDLTPEYFQTQRNLAFAYYYTAEYEKAMQILKTTKWKKHEDLKNLYQACKQQRRK